MSKAPLDRIAWGVRPPSNRPPVIDLLYPSQYGPLAGFIVSDAVLAVETHWLEKRTVPHIAPREFCRGCVEAKQQPRWNGYLLLSKQRGKVFIANITEAAANDNPALLDTTRSLRGLYLTLTRVKKSERGKVKATLTVPTEKPTLPPALDLMPVLLNLWGLHPDFPPLDPPPQIDMRPG